MESTGSENLQNSRSIQIMRTDSRQTEIEQIARKIRQAVANDPKIHYHDFLILTRHLDTYETVLTPILKEYEIPHFTDLQISMKDHPFVELIEALFAVKSHYYRYQDVMRLLKTELLIPKLIKPMVIQAFRQAKDLTENLVLKMAMKVASGYKKMIGNICVFNSSDFGVQTDRDIAITKQVNVIRNYIRQTLPPFFKALDNAKTGKEAVTLLYQFLVKQGVTDQLKNWRDTAVNAGDLKWSAA